MGVPSEGRNQVAQLIGAGVSADQFGSVGIGSDGTAFADTNSNLGTTVDTATGLTASVSGDTMTLVGTFTGNSASIEEATAYSDTNTVLLARQAISTINVEKNDTLEVTWDVQVQ